MPTHIKIGNVAPRLQYTADGIQTVFTFPFPIFKNSDLEVYIGDVKQSIGFSVLGAGNSLGGSLTFSVPPLASKIITLARHVAIERTTDFQESGEFRSKIINDEMDYLTAALQQVADSQTRSAQLATTETAPIDPTLPSPTANTTIMWNGTANGFANGPTANEVSNAQGDAQAAQAAAVSASVSETNAQASAATALAATVGKYDTKISISSVDSPYTVGHLTVDTLLNVNTTGGNVIVNLPAASGETDKRLLGINKIGAVNTVTINPNGTDTIGSAASFTQYDDTEWADLYLDKLGADWLLGNLSYTKAGPGLKKLGSTISLDIATDQSWSGSQRATFVAANTGAYDMNAGQNFTTVTTGGTVISFANVTNGQSGLIDFDNTAAGAVTVAGPYIKGDTNLLATLSVAGLYTLGYYSPDGVNVRLTNSGGLV